MAKLKTKRHFKVNASKLDEETKQTNKKLNIDSIDDADDADDALSQSDSSYNGCSALICNGNLGSPDALLAKYYPWWPKGYRQSVLSRILTKQLFYEH
jgi:hypothetical protein